MPDSSAMAGGSSDEEIIFRKKTVHKFVDSDEESISGTIIPNISAEIVNEKPEETIRTKCRRRVIRRSESESDDEADSVRVLKDKTNLSSDPLDINGQVTESNDENNSIFRKLKTKRKLNRKRDVVASSEEKPAQAKPLFADKDLYDAETSEEEKQIGEGPNTSDGYSSIPKAQDSENEENSAVRSSIESKSQEEQNKFKSLFNDKDLYDAESSEEESRKEDNSNLYDADGSADESGLVTNRKSKSKSHKEKKKKSKKGALTEVDHIHSETQRMVRESRVSLPYHRPKQRSLAEFLQRRPSTPSVTKAVRMSVEELAAMEKQLKERAKQAEEFYKSSSEEEEPEKQQSAGAEKITERSFEKEPGKQGISAESCRSLEVPLDGGNLSNSVCGESSLLGNKDTLLGHEGHLPLLCHEDLSVTDEKVISQANEIMNAAVPSETRSFLKDVQTPKFNSEVNNTGSLTPSADKKDVPQSFFNEDNSAEIETSTFKSNVEENESMNTSGVGKTFSISECNISEPGITVQCSTPFENSVSLENNLGEFVDNSENITDTLSLLEDTSISQPVDRPKQASDDSMPLLLKFQDDSGIPDVQRK
ncbi:claspin [Anabrus simplex]|uniref:claspin n=1 Tax=Anabrus simplex TaxID=316456 RepID=UPI0035A2F451